MVDFEMSDAQRCHALAVEHFVPRLAALRNYLCSGHMSETRFWKIYFILLHHRLHKEDAELLSSPQVRMLVVAPLFPFSILIHNLHIEFSINYSGCILLANIVFRCTLETESNSMSG